MAFSLITLSQRAESFHNYVSKMEHLQGMQNKYRSDGITVLYADVYTHTSVWQELFKMTNACVIIYIISLNRSGKRDNSSTFL